MPWRRGACDPATGCRTTARPSPKSSVLRWRRSAARMQNSKPWEWWTSHVGRGTFVSTRETPAGPDAETIDLATYKVAVPPVQDALARSMQAILAAQDPATILGGAPAAGLPQHRAAIAAWLQRQGVEVRPEQVIVTNGGQHSTMVALSTLTHEGEALATEDVTDPRMRAVASYLGRRLIGVDTDEHGLLPDALDHRCRTERVAAIYLTTRCQNPTTSTLPLDRRLAVAAVARRFDLPIIESDIYGTLLEDPLPPLATIAPERTHAIGAFGRIAGPGMKVGWLVSPARDVVRTQAGVGMSTGSASLMSVELASRWIADGSMETFAQWAASRQSAPASPWWARYPRLAAARSHPRSAHVWLPLPDRWRAEQVVDSAALHGIAIAPTHTFVVGRAVSPHAVRLCIGATDIASLDAACERLDRLLGTTPRIGMEAA